jgi:hypothetical protein
MCHFGCTTVSVRVWGLLIQCFVTQIFFKVSIFSLLAQLQSWKNSPFRHFATAYSIYSQLTSILGSFRQPQFQDPTCRVEKVPLVTVKLK